MDWKTSFIKVAISSSLIYRFNAVSLPVVTDFVLRNLQTDFKMYVETNDPSSDSTIVKKINAAAAPETSVHDMPIVCLFLFP